MSRHRSVIVAALLVALTSAAARAQTIAGSVKSGGKSVVGATVRLLEIDRVQRTGRNGQFSFSAVPRGSYTVFASASGYASRSKTVELTGHGGNGHVRASRIGGRAAQNCRLGLADASRGHG